MNLLNKNSLAESTVEEIRLKLLYTILFLLNAFGIPIIIIATIEASILGKYINILFYLIFFLPVLIITFFRKRLNYKLIAVVVINLGIAIAFTNIIIYGTGGAGIPLLFTAFVITVIFFNRKIALILIVISGLLMACIAYLFTTQKIALQVSLDEISSNPISWVTAIAILVFLGSLIVFSYGLIQSKMLESMKRANINAKELKEANIKLSKDIQDRKIAAKELQNSQSLLIEAQRIAKIGNWEYITKTRKLEISEVCYSLLEINNSISPSKLINTIKNTVTLSELKKFEQFIKSKNLIKENFTYHHKAKINNKVKFFTSIGAPIEDDSGNIVGYKGIIQDVTEQNNLNEEIQQLNLDLEKKILERTKDLENNTHELNNVKIALLNIVEDLDENSELLEKSAKDLKRSNKELEAFTYSVSHDLRAPLRAIDGFTQILMDDYVSQLGDEGKRIGGIIQRNTKKMGKLIDDLLAFSRLGRASFNSSQVDMDYMVKSIYNEISSVEDRARIKFTVNNLPPANADTNMMRQLWINLISNAIKYSSTRNNASITISCKESTNSLRYSIKDNGVGFNMDYQHKLFEVFQRLHSENDFEGTGVGLALVQQIISRHNGKVWGESEVDKGAEFFFSIPKSRGELNEI